MNELGRKRVEPFRPPVADAVVDREVLALDIAKIAHSALEGVQQTRVAGGLEIADPRDLSGLLRLSTPRRGREQ